MPDQELFTRALSWLSTYAVHSSVLLGAVWLFLRWRAPRSLALRERLWKLALVGPLLTATLQVGLDARPWLGRIEWRAREEAPAVRIEPAPAPAPSAGTEPAPTVAQTPLRPAPTEARPSDASRPQREPRAERRTPAPAREEAARASSLEVARIDSAEAPLSVRAPAADPGTSGPSGSPRSRELVTPPSWPGLLLCAWAALGLAGVALIAGSFLLLWRRLSGREVLREGPLVATLEELRRRAGLRRHVRLSISSRVPAPFSTGLLLPEICLPRAVVSGLTPAQQEVLLAHELGHLVRRDPFWFAAGAVLERLFFFQPLNRLARHELAELAELACDDHAVRWTGSRLALASCLTEVAGWLIEEPRRALALPGLTAPRSPLGRRIARLLDDRRSPNTEPRSRGFPALALGALGLTVAAVPGISAASPAPAREKVDVGPPVVKERALESSPLATSGPRSTVVDAPARAAEPPSEALALDELRQGLEEELARLAGELEALRAELEQRNLDARFEAELTAIEARLAALGAQHARASALLDALVPSLPNTPAQTPR